jgi:branched-chain amino acid aminotransferase
VAAIVNVNGVMTDERNAVVSVFDHGFLYGEGVYETLRTYSRRPFLLDRHLRRLRASADMIALNVPLSDRAFAERIDQTVKRAEEDGLGGGEWYVRLMLTRGVGELSYDPAASGTPSVIIIVKPLVEPAAELYAKGVATIISSIIRNHPGTVNPMIKSNNLLNCALAMQEGIRRGAYEVIMRNYKGELAECSLSNLFIVRSGAAVTPPLSAGLLPGITREYIWEVGNTAGIRVEEAVLLDRDLYEADEAFLTGTTREIMPIVSVDDRSIGNGTPGPVTRKLLETFRRLAAADRSRAPKTIGL